MNSRWMNPVSIFLCWFMMGCAFIVVLFLSYDWFASATDLNFDSDEVVWVLDAQFYQARRLHDWDKFQLNKNDFLKRWTHEKYRLIDQPQLGKYIFGFLFNLYDLEPWQQVEPSKEVLYQSFARVNLPGGVPQNLRSQLGESVVDSIVVSRKLIAACGLLAITIFSVLSWRFTGHWMMAGGVYFLLFFHPTLNYWYRVAVPNAVQINLVLLSMIIMLHFLFKKFKSWWHQALAWFLVGIMIALSTAIKLNGFFLLLFPGFYWLSELIWKFWQQRLLKLWQQNWSEKIAIYFSLLIGFVTTFVYLELEIWFHPWVGFKNLLTVRWLQQRRFRNVFQNYSFFETLFFLGQEFIKVAPNLFFKFCLLVCLGLGSYKLWSCAKSSRVWRAITWLFVFVILTSTIYADVGFERYAEWSLYVFSFVASLGGMQLLLKLKKLVVKKLNGVY